MLAKPNKKEYEKNLFCHRDKFRGAATSFIRDIVPDKPSMKTVALTLASVAATAATSSVVGYAFYKKHQFYPTVVYLTKSSPSLAVRLPILFSLFLPHYLSPIQVLYIQAFVLVILLSKLVRKIFFGRLRAAETEVTRKGRVSPKFSLRKLHSISSR